MHRSQPTILSPLFAGLVLWIGPAHATSADEVVRQHFEDISSVVDAQFIDLATVQQALDQYGVMYPDYLDCTPSDDASELYSHSCQGSLPIDDRGICLGVATAAGLAQRSNDLLVGEPRHFQLRFECTDLVVHAEFRDYQEGVSEADGRVVLKPLEPHSHELWAPIRTTHVQWEHLPEDLTRTVHATRGAVYLDHVSQTSASVNPVATAFLQALDDRGDVAAARTALVQACDRAIAEIESMRPFRGDNTLRQASLDTLRGLREDTTGSLAEAVSAYEAGDQERLVQLVAKVSEAQEARSARYEAFIHIFNATHVKDWEQ